jgi:putative peptidoglycan lipid II flippase
MDEPAVLPVYFRAMKTHDSLVRSSTVVSLATLASRILGLVRDHVIFSAFAVGLTNPFFVAYTIPNTLRRLFAEGALSAAFIPVFTESLQREGLERAARLGASLLKMLFLCLLVVAIAGSLLAPQIVSLLPSGKVVEGQEQIASQLLRIMFPYILLIGLAAATMGMLNSLGKFFAPAISPALLNVAMISFVFFGSFWFKDQALIEVLAYGVLLGGLLQFLVQIIPLQRRLPLGLVSAPLWDPRLRRVLWLMVPLAFGQAVMQFNVLISMAFAYKINAAPHLFCANRIIQFPLGVLGIAIATATFPRLSRDAVDLERAHQSVADTTVYSLKKIFFIMLPSAAGLILVGRDVIGAIYDHGEFHRAGGLEPAYFCAVFYSFGLPAFAAVKIVVSAFYARQEPKTPTITGAFVVVANVIFILLFIGPLGPGGLALATTLSAYLNLSVLTIILTHRLERPILSRLAGSLGRALFCCLLMSAGLAAAARFLPRPDGDFLLYVLRIAILFPLGLILYAIASRFFQRQEYDAILGAFMKKLKA